MNTILQKKISVITVTYNSVKEIAACIDAVIAPPDPRIEMLVIDNASADGTVDFLRDKYHGRAQLTCVFNDENVGFARGCNQGVLATTGEYILLLNPDTRAPMDQILKLAEFLDQHQDVGIVGPKIVDEHGITQESYGYDLTPMNEIVGKLMYSRYLENIPGIRSWKERRLVKDHEMDVGWIGGACTMIRRNLLDKVGGIDPAYFFSHADMIDMGKSVRNLGYRVVLYPDVIIVHEGSKSIVSNRDIVLKRAYQGTLYYFRKYYGNSTVFSVKVIYVLLSMLKAMVSLPLSVIKKDPYRDIGMAHAKKRMANYYRRN